MPISSHPLVGQVHQITLSGLLTWSEYQAFLDRVETQNAFASGKVNILIKLDNFLGLEPGEQWSDVSFFFRHDKDIEKIAVVSDAHWQDSMQIFLFTDYRQAESRFFPEAELEQARAWLMR